MLYRCNNCKEVFEMSDNQVKQWKKNTEKLLFCNVKCSGQYYANKQHKEMSEEQKLTMKKKISATLKERNNIKQH